MSVSEKIKTWVEKILDDEGAPPLFHPPYVARDPDPQYVRPVAGSSLSDRGHLMRDDGPLKKSALVRGHNPDLSSRA